MADAKIIIREGRYYVQDTNGQKFEVEPQEARGYLEEYKSRGVNVTVEPQEVDPEDDGPPGYSFDDKDKIYAMPTGEFMDSNTVEDVPAVDVGKRLRAGEQITDYDQEQEAKRWSDERRAGMRGELETGRQPQAQSLVVTEGEPDWDLKRSLIKRFVEEPAWEGEMVRAGEEAFKKPRLPPEKHSRYKKFE